MFSRFTAHCTVRGRHFFLHSYLLIVFAQYGKLSLASRCISARFTASLYPSGGPTLTWLLSDDSPLVSFRGRFGADPASPGEPTAQFMPWAWVVAGALPDAVLQVSSDETCLIVLSASHYPSARLRGDESTFQGSRLAHVCLLSMREPVGRVREMKYRPAKNPYVVGARMLHCTFHLLSRWCMAHGRWPRLHKCKH